MNYKAVVEMAQSSALRGRVTACVAEQAVTRGLALDPVSWTRDNIWHIAVSPNWADDWAYAVDTATPNVNPDTGARIDVIDDNKILSAVQARLDVTDPPA